MSPIYSKWETIRSYSSLQTHAYAEWAWKWWYARKWKWHDNKSNAFFRSQNPRQINCALILYILLAQRSYKIHTTPLPCWNSVWFIFQPFFGNLIKPLQGYIEISSKKDVHHISKWCLFALMTKLNNLGIYQWNKIF